MFIRKLHRVIGAIVGPFLLVTAIAGLLTLAGYFNPTVFRLHNWRIVGRWLGIAVASGLALQVITGFVLLVQMRLQQLRRWLKKRREAGRSDGRIG